MTRRLTQSQADALAERLELDLEQGICHACLSFVSFALDDGEPREIARQVRSITPDLWREGLEEQALAAVARARTLGVPGAGEALVELELRGGSSIVARSIVKRLARMLSQQTRTAMAIEGIARPRLGLSPPELN
jgi:hypothetical protein